MNETDMQGCIIIFYHCLLRINYCKERGREKKSRVKTHTHNDASKLSNYRNHFQISPVASI